MADRDIKPFTAEALAISRQALTTPDELYDYQAEETARWVVTLDQERARAEAAEAELGRLRATHERHSEQVEANHARIRASYQDSLDAERERAKAAEAALAEHQHSVADVWAVVADRERELATLRAAARAALDALNDSPNDMADACEQCLRLATREVVAELGGRFFYCDDCPAPHARDLEYAAAVRALRALLPPEPAKEPLNG